MKAGASKSRVAMLAALILLAAYSVYSNFLSGPDRSPSGSPAPAAPAAAAKTAAPSLPPSPTIGMQPNIRRAGARARSGEDFRPTLKFRPEDVPDPTAIDPTLRLDLLSKVQGVEPEGGSRNVFQFSAAPPPPLPKGPEPKIAARIPGGLPGGAPPPPKPDAIAAKPLAPPINLKYYGYTNSHGSQKKTAFFLDGDEIVIAGEGDTVKKRYKVVRIGVSSVVMEDTVSKSQQTLPLAEEAMG
jgi:hypothetical protein